MNQQQNQTTAVAKTDPRTLQFAEPSASIIEVASRLPPRDLVAVANQIKSVACSSGRMAQACIYCRPVGKKNGKQTFAVGPSVRWVELAQQAFGRLWIAPNVIEHTKTVEAIVMCIDLITLNVTFGRASRSIVGRNGRFPDHMVETTANAQLSIARRNAILQQTRAQWEEMQEDIKKTILKSICPGNPNDKQVLSAAWKELVSRFEGMGVPQEKLIEATDAESDKLERIILAVGIYNAINDGAVKIEDVFGHIAPRKTPPAGQGNAKSPAQPAQEPQEAPGKATEQSQEPPPPAEEPEQAEMTPQQQFNNLTLELEMAGKGEELSEITTKACEKLNKQLDDFSQNDFAALNDELRKVLESNAE